LLNFEINIVTILVDTFFAGLKDDDDRAVYNSTFDFKFPVLYFHPNNQSKKPA